jgi:hypothetical protein
VEQAGAYPGSAEVRTTARVVVAPRAARRLAWLALAAQPVFVAAWIVAGALEPGYSHLEQTFSELSARNASHPGVMEVGYIALGVSMLALAPALLSVLPPRPASRAAAALFALSGLAVLAVGVVPLDCGLTVDRACIDAFDAGRLSWRTPAHLWAGLVFEVAFVATPFAIARALWPRHVALPVLLAAGSGVPILVASLAAGDLLGVPMGLAQRLGFLAVHVWIVLVAVGILHSTRPAPAPGPLIPMRPRDFFGRAWAGRGELTFWPYRLWQRAPRRFELRREVDWVTDQVWLVRDVVRFDDGEVEAHDMVARLDGPDRVHVMGDDVPGGTDLLLDQRGYRMTPYRFTVPVGPLRFALRPRDEVRMVGDDGALEWTVHFRWLGLPMARLRGVVRPVGDPAPEER